METKKLALLRVLQILEHYTDADHHLKQEEIVDILEHEYGMVVERKAVGRNLALLREAGYDIASDRRGSWLASRLFDDAELRMLIDGVLSARHVTVKYSRDLIDRLCSLTGRNFRSHVKHVYSVGDWDKTENKSVFYNVATVDEGIEKGVRLTFDYNKYGADGRLHKSASHEVSPYQMLLKNRNYYLMAYNEKWHDMGYYRLDRITNIELSEAKLTPLRSLPGYENGIDYKEIATALPYMFNDKPEIVVFYADEGVADDIVDWFGNGARMEKEEGRLKVSVKASPLAMEYWAMQYLNAVEVRSPEKLRAKIKENLRRAAVKYGE